MLTMSSTRSSDSSKLYPDSVDVKLENGQLWLFLHIRQFQCVKQSPSVVPAASEMSACLWSTCLEPVNKSLQPIVVTIALGHCWVHPGIICLLWEETFEKYLNSLTYWLSSQLQLADCSYRLHVYKWPIICTVGRRPVGLHFQWEHNGQTCSRRSEAWLGHCSCPLCFSSGRSSGFFLDKFPFWMLLFTEIFGCDFK